MSWVSASARKMITRVTTVNGVDVIFVFVGFLKILIPPGLEPGTLRVLGARDNHYTTESCDNQE